MINTQILTHFKIIQPRKKPIYSFENNWFADTMNKKPKQWRNSHDKHCFAYVFIQSMDTLYFSFIALHVSNLTQKQKTNKFNCTNIILHITQLFYRYCLFCFKSWTSFHHVLPFYTEYFDDTCPETLISTYFLNKFTCSKFNQYPSLNNPSCQLLCVWLVS